MCNGRATGPDDSARMQTSTEERAMRKSSKIGRILAWNLRLTRVR